MQNIQSLISPDSKLSSLLESPPPLTDPTPEKGIKDFNRKYLNTGMWPSKLNSNIHEYKIQTSGNKNYETLNSDKLKYSMTHSSKQGCDLMNTSSNKSNKFHVPPIPGFSKAFSTADRTMDNKHNTSATMYPNIDQTIV